MNTRKTSTPTGAVSYSWTDIWTAAITRPRPDTYAMLLQDSNTRPVRAFWWMYLTGMVLALVTYNTVFNNPAFQSQLAQMAAQQGTALDGSSISQVLLLLTMCATPFAAIFNVLLYGLLALAIHRSAQRLTPERKVEHQASLFYLMGAVIAPLTVISALANILPEIIGLVIALGVIVFQAYAFVQIARAVYQLEMRQAILAAAVPTVLMYALQWLVLGALL